MKNIIYIDAPTAFGKTRYIKNIIEEFKSQGLKTLALTDLEMCEMLLLSTKLLSDGVEETPLVSIALEYDVLAVDDIDVGFAGKNCAQEMFVDFIVDMAKKGKQILLAGTNIKKRLPILYGATEEYAEWLPVEELKAI